MSKTRPYVVNIGGQVYMIEATTREQSMRAVLDKMPLPVASAHAANMGELSAWYRSGRPIYTKDDVVPVLPETIEIQADESGTAYIAGKPVEPGFYHLAIMPRQEPTVPLEHSSSEPSGTSSTESLSPTGDVLEEIHEQGVEALNDIAAEEEEGKAGLTAEDVGFRDESAAPDVSSYSDDDVAGTSSDDPVPGEVADEDGEEEMVVGSAVQSLPPIDAIPQMRDLRALAQFQMWLAEGHYNVSTKLMAQYGKALRTRIAELESE